MLAGLTGATEEEGLRVDEIVHLVDDVRPVVRDWLQASRAKDDVKMVRTAHALTVF
jgi:hypothetical protein